jgi:hypothetical protein
VSNYHIVYAEVRRISDDKLILHDHGGATCSDCMNATLAELQALESDRDGWRREAMAWRAEADAALDMDTPRDEWKIKYEAAKRELKQARADNENRSNP